VPPLPPAPPPEFLVLPTESPSVPPPPAFPGAPRAKLPLEYPSAPVFVPVYVKVINEGIAMYVGVPAMPSPFDPFTLLVDSVYIICVLVEREGTVAGKSPAGAASKA